MQSQLERLDKAKVVQQDKLRTTQQLSGEVKAELSSVQAALSPLELEVDKLSFLMQGLAESLNAEQETQWP
jgi:septal ring factor EnvC (AmiA/AmiB activator)